MISFGYWRDVELYRRPKPSNMLLWMVRESLGESDIRDGWIVLAILRLSGQAEIHGLERYGEVSGYLETVYIPEIHVNGVIWLYRDCLEMCLATRTGIFTHLDESESCI